MGGVQKIKATLFLFRPDVIFLGTGLIFLAGFLANLTVWHQILLFITSLGIFGAANSANEYFDVELDKISRPHAQIVRGVVSGNWALYLSISLYITTIIAFFLLFNFLAFLLAFLAVLISIAYSTPPIHLKNHSILGTLSVTMPIALLFLIAYVSGNKPITPPITLWFVILTLNLFTAILSKDFKDIRAERKLNVRTPVVVFNPNKLARACVVFSIFPLLLIVLLVYLAGFSPYLLLSIPIIALLKFFPARLLLDDPIKNGYKIFRLNMVEATLTPYILAITIYFGTLLI